MQEVLTHLFESCFLFICFVCLIWPLGLINAKPCGLLKIVDLRDYYLGSSCISPGTSCLDKPLSGRCWSLNLLLD